MRTALFWAISQRLVVISYRRFGTTYMRFGPIGCPETWTRNYHYSLRNIPEERSSHLLRGGSLKSHKNEWSCNSAPPYIFCMVYTLLTTLYWDSSLTLWNLTSTYITENTMYFLTEINRLTPKKELSGFHWHRYTQMHIAWKNIKCIVLITLIIIIIINQ